MNDPELKSKSARRFIEIYRDLPRGTSGLPLKSALQPETFYDCLGNIFIIERQDGNFRFRLFGSHIVEMVGKDMTSLTLEELGMNAEDLAQIREILTRCLTKPTIIRSEERLVLPHTEYHIVEILRCPFEGDKGDVNFVSGTFERIEGTVQPLQYKVLREQEIEWDHRGVNVSELHLNQT